MGDLALVDHQLVPEGKGAGEGAALEPDEEGKVRELDRESGEHEVHALSSSWPRRGWTPKAIEGIRIEESAQPFAWAADNRAMTARRHHNPHDKLFKAVFSEPKNAVAHFATCLPPELVAALDLSKAQHVPGSWVDEALRDRHSDVAHSIPLRGSGSAGEQPDSILLHTIWEHQSTVDEMMSFRAHLYSSRLLEEWSREHPRQRLPPVIVLVLYHGQAEWTAPEELEELFALDGVTPAVREALRPFLPKQRYLLEVVPEDPAKVRSGRGIARLTLITLKLGRSVERWAVIFECKEDLEDLLAKGKPGLHYLGLLVEYVMMVNPEATQESLSEVLKPMGTEAQALPKTYGMRLVEQGVEQGRREEKAELARRALAKGMSPTEVAELTGLPLEEVQKLAH